MQNLIKKYLLNQTGFESDFSPPAEESDIQEAEEQLKFFLPNDLKRFYLTTNGFEGPVGEGYVMICKIGEMAKLTEAYCNDYCLWAIYFGSNGGGEMYILDKRGGKTGFGMLPYIGEECDFILLGETFEEFLKHLYFQDFGDVKP